MFVIIAKAIKLFSELLVLLVLADVFLSYFLHPYHPVREFIHRLVEPLLAPIRRVVPLVGMIDFSPAILIILIQILSGMLVNIFYSL